MSLTQKRAHSDSPETQQREEQTASPRNSHQESSGQLEDAERPTSSSSSSIDELIISSHNVNSMIPLLTYLSQPRLRFTPQHARKRRKLSSSDGSDDESTPPLWNPTTRLIQDHSPHVICLQEVKATTRDPSLIRALPLVPQRKYTGLTTAQQPFGYTAHWSLSHAKRGKNFGVVTYVRDDVQVLGTREVEWDKEGRVVVVELPGVAIYNVYALNGSENPWINPQTGKPEGTRNERKRAFNRLLMADVNRQRGNPSTPHIILLGDFNISLTPADCFPRLRTEHPHALARREFVDEVMPGMAVVDIWRRMHGPLARGYSWFAVGKPFRSDAARVDYALVSEEAVPRVTSVEYLETMQGGSDHCPFVLKYDVT